MDYVHRVLCFISDFTSVKKQSKSHRRPTYQILSVVGKGERWLCHEPKVEIVDTIFKCERQTDSLASAQVST